MICLKWKPRVRELSSGQLELFAKMAPGCPWRLHCGAEDRSQRSGGGGPGQFFRSSFLNPPLEFILFVMSCLEIITDSQEVAQKERLQGGPMYLSPSSPKGHVTRIQRLDRKGPAWICPERETEGSAEGADVKGQKTWDFLALGLSTWEKGGAIY